MGWAWAGETGLLSGFSWAVIVNYQQQQPWFRRPWLHAGGMIAGYTALRLAAEWEDVALQTIIQRYERKGYDVGDRRELFEPAQRQVPVELHESCLGNLLHTSPTLPAVAGPNLNAVHATCLMPAWPCPVLAADDVLHAHYLNCLLLSAFSSVPSLSVI